MAHLPTPRRARGVALLWRAFRIGSNRWREMPACTACLGRPVVCFWRDVGLVPIRGQVVGPKPNKRTSRRHVGCLRETGPCTIDELTAAFDPGCVKTLCLL